VRGKPAVLCITFVTEDQNNQAILKPKNINSFERSILGEWSVGSASWTHGGQHEENDREQDRSNNVKQEQNVRLAMKEQNERNWATRLAGSAEGRAT
jgi:hypothetical protein